MGYYSDFDGEFTPATVLTQEQKDKILAWFKQRFRDYDIGDFYDECRVKPKEVEGKLACYLGDIYFDPRDGNIYPTCPNMKGYDFNEHLFEAMQFCKSIGVKYCGKVERTGEEEGDYEGVKVMLDGSVLSYEGRVVYGNPVEVTMTEAQKNEVMEKRLNIQKEAWDE